MTTIKVVAGDKGFDLNFTLQNSDGTAFDITGGTILMRTQLASNSSINFSHSMSITGAGSAGTCKYTVQNGDFAAAGTYNAQIQVTLPSSIVVTFADIQIIASAALPLSV